MKEDKRYTCTSRNCLRYSNCDTAAAEPWPMPWMEYYPDLCGEGNGYKYFAERDDTERSKYFNVETNIFDIEEIYPNCTVQLLRNSVTGEESIGWWVNDSEEC